MAERKPISRVVVALGQEPADISSLVERFPHVDFETVGGDDLETRAPEADALLIGWVGHALTRESAPRLQWIQTAGAGVERYIEEGLIGEGIVLTNGSGVMAPNMAEYAIGMMIAFARRFPALWRGQERHLWRPGLGLDSFFELGDQTVVFVGLGDIAQETAKRLAGFGMHTIGVRRTVHSGDLPSGIDRVVSIDELDDVLPLADHVISSVPSTESTRHLFDGERFRQFKRGAYFYNLGRGTSVVQDDLIAALESGQLGGAGLDVTEPEPLPGDHPLWNAPNVFITSHTSGMTPRFRGRVIELFADNLERWESGEELRNVVDTERGY
jgi:phosphoglycerate dehydrogenase-like enzyme